MKALVGRFGWRFVLSSGATLAVAGGIAYAAIPDAGTSTYHACLLKNVGTIRIIDPALPASSLLQHCTTLETAITFNQQGAKGDAGTPGLPGVNGAPGLPGAAGAAGAAGQSVTEANATPADCANGGVALTAANGTSFVCNGKDGKDGKDGADGAPGTNGTNGSGLAKIEDLNGVSCTDVNGKASTVSLTLAPDGTVRLNCTTVPTPPPPPAPFTLTPSSIFVAVSASSATRSFTLTNNSTGPANINSITALGGSTTTNTCGTQLTAGASCQITLKVVVVGGPCNENSDDVQVILVDSSATTVTLTATLDVLESPGSTPCP